MKNPTIQVSFSKNKNIEISLGNNEMIKFPNKTLAKAFQFKLKRLIKDNIISLSNLESQIYNCYRENYLYFPSITGRKILNNIQAFDNKIDFVFKEYSQGNGGFVFHSLDHLFAFINNSIDLMTEYAQKYKSFALKNQMYALTNLVEMLEKDFHLKKLDLELCYAPKRKLKVIKLITALNG
jgi:hypothetical protein